MGHAEDAPVGRDCAAELPSVRQVRIPTEDDGTTLAADLYRPPNAGRSPTLVTLVPYRKDAIGGITYDHALRWFAQRGYNCLLVDCRGTGSSDGPPLPPFDPREADDAVSVISWVERQAWSDGSVGMWGSSYGGMTAMKTALQKPPALKCIISMVAMIDPELDFVHPDGGSSDLGPFAMWGANTLALQLLPPLRPTSRAEDDQRWVQRLNENEPYLADLMRLEPGDAVWRERAINPALIEVPTFCVGGWRDMCTDSMVRAYEAIPAAKKLLVGPWMHSQPQDSPFATIDFLPIALRWWDHWLLGRDTALLSEPPVIVYVQETQPAWHSFDSWPPTPKEVRWAGDLSESALRRGVSPGKRPPSPRCLISDPTVGSLSGLWGVPTAGYGLPIDQQDDDARSMSLTTNVLGRGLVLAGRPYVQVTLMPGAARTDGSQLFVRLTDVDADGHSHLITAGGAPVSAGPVTLVPLRTTAYHLAPGHRLRISISDADFPRMRPRAVSSELYISDVVVVTPVVPATLGKPLDIPERRPRPRTSDDRFDPVWSINRDLVNERVEVVLGHDSSTRTTDGWVLETHRVVRAAVARHAPAEAAVSAHEELAVRDAVDMIAKVSVDLRVSGGTVLAHATVERAGKPVFSRTWDLSTPEPANDQRAVSSRVNT